VPHVDVRVDTPGKCRDLSVSLTNQREKQKGEVMPFVGPNNPAEAKPLDWLVRGQMRGTFLFKDPTLASTVSYSIVPSNLVQFQIGGFIGDENFEDDIFSLEPFEAPLQLAPPAKRFLSVFLMPRERQGKPFTFFLSFFSDQTDFPNQDYEFRSDGHPIGIRIPVRFV
jgi:hypothetical protein